MSFLLPSSPARSSPDPFDAGVVTRAQHRKRTLSGAGEEEVGERKRPRPATSHFSAWFRSSRRSVAPLHNRADQTIDRDVDINDLSAPILPTVRRPRISASTSFSERSFSRASSVASTTIEESIGLRRSASVSSLRGSEIRRPTPPPVPESAMMNLRSNKIIVDFSVADEDTKRRVWPVSWSETNYLVFGRGNRVHYKNLSANEAIGQLCKFREDQGNLRVIQCAGADQPNIVAVCTVKGHIQIWDLSAKKLTAKWTTKATTAMQWNGPVLTVGGERGAIRHFDTRVRETNKMKEQTKKTTRHQAQISALAWNKDGKFLASGDESGTVHIWDSRQNAPLEVGEMVQRRKKIQHVGLITALAWCPWQTQTLATGGSAPDGSGTVRIWNVNNSLSSNHPNHLDLDAQVTSLHFSPHCKELLSTHGPGIAVPPRAPTLHLESHTFPEEPGRARFANSVVVHAFPSLRHLVTVEGAKVNVAGSVLSPNGQRLVLAVPEESKLRVWDVWGKRRELKRTSSMMSECSIR